jgi:hypothetical protein
VNDGHSGPCSRRASSLDWTGVVSMCRDKYECLLIEKDVEIAQSTVSKDAMIYKLRQELQSSTQSLKNKD